MQNNLKAMKCVIKYTTPRVSDFKHTDTPPDGVVSWPPRALRSVGVPLQGGGVCGMYEFTHFPHLSESSLFAVFLAVSLFFFQVIAAILLGYLRSAISNYFRVFLTFSRIITVLLGFEDTFPRPVGYCGGVTRVSTRTP